MDDKRIQYFQSELLSWYRQENRDLPWRQTDDPYAIWISEVMLQQTQVNTVIPYFNRFMQAFPTVQNLASAEQDSVLKLWEGLGYYTRARNMHKAAKKIVDDFGGIFPKTLEDVKSLPGIGEYTAAAIMSIVYGADSAVVDGNVVRVLSRVELLRIDPKSTLGKNEFAATADRFLAHGDAGDYNQAIMELGATICKPRRPQCLLCPVAEVCKARQEQVQHELPVKRKPGERPHKHIAIALVWRDGRILIDKRDADKMLGGLWEFPGGKIEENETAEAAVVREIKEETGLDIEVRAHFMDVDHEYSHLTVTLHAYHCDWLAGTAQAIDCTEVRWVKVEDLQQYPFPRANGKILERIIQTHGANLG